MRSRHLLVLGTLATLCAHCQRGAAPASPTSTPLPPTAATVPATPAAAPAPAASRILRFALDAEPQFLDPGLADDFAGVQVDYALFEGLVAESGENKTIVPGVAERWEISPDGKQYTFYLRKNARWSDGKPVTAHDFVYAWERVLNPATASEYSFLMFYLKNGKDYNSGKLKDPAQLGFKAIDDYTLSVELENPTAYMMELFTYWTYSPVPRWTIEQHGPQWVLGGKMVSNGPFQLTEWSPHKLIAVVKNPHYWDAAAVKLPGINYQAVEDKETALRMYETGELDIVPGIPELKIPQFSGRPDFLLYPYLANDYLEMNSSRPFFADKRVRRALTMALDRKTLAEQYLQKMKMPTDSFVPPGLGTYVSPPGLPYDPVSAKALLAEAGYADPAKLPTIELSYNSDSVIQQMAQVVQRMWKENLGLTATLTNKDYKTHLKEMKLKNFDVGRKRWIGDYADPNTYLELYTSYSGMNYGGWGSADYDALIEQAAREPDTAKRLLTLQNAEKILLDSAPIIPLYVHYKAMLIRPEVKGFYKDYLDHHPVKTVWLQ